MAGLSAQDIFINGQWHGGQGIALESLDPAYGRATWSGGSASEEQVSEAFYAARCGFEIWSQKSFAYRAKCVQCFAELADKARDKMAELISRETGKLLWDSQTEAAALVGKVDISLQAYEQRTGQTVQDMAFGQATLSHHPHGVMAVFGPYNFPAHLPNGQILPALLAGNSVVFKPSEFTPAVGKFLIELYAQAGFPDGVINLLQGGREVGGAMLAQNDLNGVLFTGSAQTGAYIHKYFGGRPDIVLALEMGGNNPLVVWDVTDIEAAIHLIIHSAYVSSGQRCTCARRLIIRDDATGQALTDALCTLIDKISVGAWDAKDQAMLGPLINADVAALVCAKAATLVDCGAKPLIECKIARQGSAFVYPGLYDVTACDVPDEEIFGPVLQLIRVSSWQEAIRTANATRFGLAAGLISDHQSLWQDFCQKIRAGVVNFNRPTTGAVSSLPFGGLGASGNHQPGAYYAADICAWPMASQVALKPEFTALTGLR